MASYITYNRDTKDQEYDKIGGSCLLPETVDWPIDRHGNKMLFLASLSSDMLKSQCGMMIPEGQILSIFCPYKPDDVECAIDMARGREKGYMMTHLPAQPRQESEYPISGIKKIELNLNFETDEDEFSEELDDKIGGQPNWLQDRFNYTGYDFVLQLSGLSFGKNFADHKNLLMGGMLYIFYNPLNNSGLLTLQYS